MEHRLLSDNDAVRDGRRCYRCVVLYGQNLNFGVDMGVGI